MPVSRPLFGGDQVSKIHGLREGSMLSKLNPRDSKYSNKFCEAIKSFTQASQSDAEVIKMVKISILAI